MQRKLWLFASFIFTLLRVTRADAVMVTPFNIEELTQRADKVFAGTCVKISRGVTAQNIPVVEVTFSVAEKIKGEIGETITFQQIDPQGQRLPAPAPAADERIREAPQGIFSAAAIAGLPSYSVGEEAVMFLAAPGRLGLTAPIGLTQGKLPVTTLASGEKVVTNSSLRKTALTNSALPEPGKGAQYGRFLIVLRTLAGSHQQ
jgi:hypothetical protein